jgi:hypothetical protein
MVNALLFADLASLELVRRKDVGARQLAALLSRQAGQSAAAWFPPTAGQTRLFPASCGKQGTGCGCRFDRPMKVKSVLAVFAGGLFSLVLPTSVWLRRLCVGAGERRSEEQTSGAWSAARLVSSS